MLFSKESFVTYAQSQGLEIDDEAINILSQDIEYRVKELCQEASKFMLFSKRSKLAIEDINNALITRNVDPLFGYDPKDNLIFKNDLLKSSIFYVPDEEIDLEEFLEQPLPKIPAAPTITAHWLAIEGVQPQVPQNPIVVEKPIIKQNQLTTYTEESEFKNTTKHIISKELSLYYEKLLSFLEDEEKVTLAIECLKTESGIQQLIPYLIQNIKEKIVKYMNTEQLPNFISFYYSLLQNEFIFIDPYLHQMIPSLLTTVIGKRVKTVEIRKLGADAIKYVFDKYSKKYDTLGPRIIKSLTKVWLDPTKSEDSHYGALYTLSILSPYVVESVIKYEKERYLEITKDLNYCRVNALLMTICVEKE
ncbi:Transcription initiation factor TFIID, subunit TAF6 [Pseudoloma neurophilia]|uniref:Transcription initiation factor TFIID, subunit TAF6 n=1 Tax=Pseudoloma neurophilia TaxID=146866 RepID=A0A0R0M534_9MICR|nr:Transcription initiation factor TFIID, subunit TAF6 [Pseudoloma neurophilia]